MMAFEKGKVTQPEPTGTPASFAALSARMQACRICADRPEGAPLPHLPRPVFRGRPGARILIAGQAPGTRVHLSGTPFTDRSGDTLRGWLGMTVEAFYDEGRVAIMPMGLCFPGQDAKGADLPPRRECAPVWRGAFLSHFSHIALVLAIGAHAQRWHLGEAWRGSVSASVADWRHIMETPRHLVPSHAATPLVRVVPLPHPSWRTQGWRRRLPAFEAELLPALRKMIAALD